MHTILLLGIDSDGYVIIGDSVKRSKSEWGSDGLVKTGKITVRELLDCMKTEKGWAISEGSYKNTDNYFYQGKVDTGYLMVCGGE